MIFKSFFRISFLNICIYSYKILIVFNYDKIKVKIIFGEIIIYVEKCY